MLQTSKEENSTKIVNRDEKAKEYFETFSKSFFLSKIQKFH